MNSLPPPASSPKKIILGLMVALTLWASMLAIGAWRYNYDLRRPLIVIACMACFLGFWGLLLLRLRNRNSQ